MEKICWITRMCSGLLSFLSPLLLRVLSGPAVQLGGSKGQQSSRWLPAWWMMGTGGGWPSSDKEPILTGASSPSLSSVTRCRQREMDVQLGGWNDGWGGDRRRGTWHNPSSRVIGSPSDPSFSSAWDPEGHEEGKPHWGQHVFWFCSLGMVMWASQDGFLMF